MRTESKAQKSKEKRGRLQGSKNNLPFTTFPATIGYAKNIWDKAQYNEISFNEISDSMGLHAKKSVRVLSALNEYYGVVEKTDTGNWRLTDAGKRLVKNEQAALKEVFTKNQMFADIYSTFGTKQVTEGVILEYIKKKYNYVDAEEVKKRYLEGMELIKKSTSQKSSAQAYAPIERDSVLPLFQLRYALKPATKEEIDSLATQIIKKLGASGDETLKLLAELMHEKSKDQQELANLLDKAMRKLGIDSVLVEKKGKKKPE